MADEGWGMDDPRGASGHGRGESPKRRVDRLIREGRIAHLAVEAARLWEGVALGNGESAFVTENDLYHVLVDDRILRKPERIRSILANILELRAAKRGRRMGLSRWDESGITAWGYVILEPDGSVRTMHVLDERGMRKKTRRGERIWPL
ncbi:MAG: hypothetical protein HYU88_04490 [Chloroflexi bacterium]|nr:hypothetical protein [Chloroflexota bacterium]